MLSARDIAGHPGGDARRRSRRCARADCASPASRCCATSRACRATCTPTRSTSRRRCSRCATRSARRCCSCARRRRRTPAATRRAGARPAKLAMLAVPLGIRIAYEALSWGRHVNEYPQAWEIVEPRRPRQPRRRRSTRFTCSRRHRARRAGARRSRTRSSSSSSPTSCGRRSARRRSGSTPRGISACFPGEGVHSAEVAALVRRLDEMGYRGDYSFEVFNDDYVQLPLAWWPSAPRVGEMAHRAGVAAQPADTADAAVSGKRRRLRRDGRSDTVAGSRPRRRLQRAEWQAWSSSIARYTANLWARGRGCQSRIRIDCDRPCRCDSCPQGLATVRTSTASAAAASRPRPASRPSPRP